MPALFITAAIAYFLGSIPFGFMVVRRFRGEDVRQSGSGNIGATNVARSSLALGLLTLVLDALKGGGAVLLTRQLFPEKPALAFAAALFAVVGHIFPVWLKFRGGKGVATALGSFTVLAPKSVLLALGIFVLIIVLSRYVSLASMIVVILFPALAWQLDGASLEEAGLMAFISFLILFKHHGNIGRLMAGTEPHFRLKHE